MKKILLINSIWRKETKSIFRYLYGLFPPLGISLLASILEEKGHYVKIIDCSAEGIMPKNINGHLTEEFDFIGISAMTQSALYAYEIARYIKEKSETSTVIMGGIHATAMPEEVISAPYIDVCVRGEGEETIKEIVDGVQLERIKGIAYKKDGEIIYNPEREMIKDINEYPLPAYHLLPMEKYRSMLGVAIKEPSIGLVISRWCPGKCEYCYPNALGDKVRMKSPEKIIEEILLLKNEYGIREIDFYDDTFTIYKKRIYEMCELLIKNNIDLTWSCLTRTDFVDDELLKLMKRAGCHQVMYGVESGSDRIREQLNKKIEENFKEVFKKTQSIGIQIRATYIIGNYAETAEDIEKTIEYSKQLNSDFAVFNVCTPYPGTKLYKRLENEGRILTKEWSKYDFFNVVFKHPNLTEKEILEFYKRANKEFYFRLIVFLRQFKNFLSITRTKLLFRIMKGMIKGIIQWKET